MTAQHDRCGDLYVACSSVDLSPVIEQSILEHHSVWQEERESGSLLTHHEQAELFSELSVVTLLRLFQHGQILFKFCFLRERCSIDPLQHLVLLTASPVSSRKACKLERLHRLGSHKMRACTEVSKLSLRIEADRLILRQVLDQFYFIGLVLLFKVIDRLVSRHGVLFDLQVLLDDLLHLRLDLLQIFCGQRSLSVHIIVESVCDGRTDRKLCIRVQSLDRLRHDMGRCMAECSFSLLIVERQDIQLAVLVHDCPQVNDFSVKFSGCCHPRKSLADVKCDVIHAHRLVILFK